MERPSIDPLLGQAYGFPTNATEVLLLILPKDVVLQGHVLLVQHEQRHTLTHVLLHPLLLVIVLGYVWTTFKKLCCKYT